MTANAAIVISEREARRRSEITFLDGLARHTLRGRADGISFTSECRAGSSAAWYLHAWPKGRCGSGWVKEVGYWWVQADLPVLGTILDVNLPKAAPRGAVSAFGLTEDELETVARIAKNLMALGDAGFTAGLIDVYEVFMMLDGPRHVAAFDELFREHGARRGLVVVAQDDDEDGDFSRSLWFQRPVEVATPAD